jgi:sigma-B regulation protein RsbU (phosphoserine phosphatase)
VMMAVTHAIAHTRDEPPTPPCELLEYINARLAARYTNNGTFVTAFYAIYDPADRTLTYSNAGHNAPIVRHANGQPSLYLDDGHGLPLGILPGEKYEDASVTLAEGDVLMIYTDGITEARRGSDGEMFGVERLESVLCSCARDADAIIARTTKAVNDFTDFAPAKDDRTLVVGLLR